MEYYYTCTAFPDKNFRDLDSLIEKTRRQMLEEEDTIRPWCYLPISWLKEHFPNKERTNVYFDNKEFYDRNATDIDKGIYTHRPFESGAEYIEYYKNLAFCSPLEEFYFYGSFAEPRFFVYPFNKKNKMVVKMDFSIWKNDKRIVHQTRQYTITKHKIAGLNFED